MDEYYYDEPVECPGVRDFRIDPDTKLKDDITEEELRRYPILQKYIDAEEKEEIKKSLKEDDKSENKMLMESVSSPYMYKDQNKKEDPSVYYFDTSNSSNTDYISDNEDEDEDEENYEYKDEDEAVDENIEKSVMKKNTDLGKEYEKLAQAGCWLSIKNYKDIKKQILQKGLSLLETPKNGDICTINFVGTLENGTIVDSGFNCKVFIGYQTISEVLYL
jgi:FKBP-type peptidyl-prolyl cis-trans isomerase